MTQKKLADALGMNQSQVSRYARRGMPMDVQGAQAWMRANIRLTMRAPQVRQQTTAHTAAPGEAVDPERALDDVALLGNAAELLLRAGQPLTALEPLLRDALCSVPQEHRDRIAFSGTDDEMVRLCGRMPARRDRPDDAVLFPIIVWHALVEPVLRVVRAEQEKLGWPVRLTDDEAEEMGAFWYRVAAGEVISAP